MGNLTVKIDDWVIGGVTHGVDCRVESFPLITLPHVSYTREIIPERFVPNYKVKKTQIQKGSMTLVINAIPTKSLVMSGSHTLLYKNYIEPLTHKATVDVEFSEEVGVVYVCEVDEVSVTVIGEVSNAYRYEIGLSITKIKNREV